MSTASELPPESVEPTPPFYRRPLVLIIAGAVLLLLIVGGILTAVTLSGRHPAAHLAAGTTSRPTTARTPSPRPSHAPSPTPTPTPSVVQPQAGAAAPAAPAAPAPKAPAAPVAPVAPVAPAPAPPVNVGPGRTSDAQIAYFTTNNLTNCSAQSTTATSTFYVNLAWNTSGGKQWTLWDQQNDLHFVSPGKSVGASGSIAVAQLCTNLGGVDTYRLTVVAAVAGGKTAVAFADGKSHFE